MRIMHGIRLRTFLTLAAIGLASCTGHQSARQAKLAEQEQDWDKAVLEYLQIADEHPKNVSYRQGLIRAKLKASQMHFERGKDLHAAGALQPALNEYRQAVQLDPSNQYAQVELEKLFDDIAYAESHSDPRQTLAQMKDDSRGAKAQPPVLNPRSNEPISLSFPRAVSIQDIYQALGKAFGINILFDPKLRDQQIAIELEQVTAQDSLEILMRAAKHFYKVLDEHTIIVVEDTPQNRKAYEDLIIQTFFLSNAEPKEVMTMLRSLVGAKNIAENPQLNAIVMRDSADKVKVAENIINTNDKSRGEVVVDVELLEIDTKKVQELGILLTQYNVTQFLDPALSVGDTGAFRVSDLEFINQSNWLVTIPGFVYDFMKQTTEAQLLASPQVRISDGEKALVHIGDQVPIPVTTFNSANTIGGNIVPITSFQYQDIGIRLDLEPRIHHNKEITLKLKIEVSALSGFVGSDNQAQQPIIATRRIESNIRLMDGETNFLAGLIRTDEIVTDTGIPGLMDIPVIGRLFTHKETDVDRTDLILTLTPHIIRTPNIDEEDLLPIWVGTEANITFRGGSPRVESEVEGPFEDEEREDADRIREMIRRRIQNLPRGLQDAAEEGEEPEEQPSGQNLSDPGTPGDFFGEEGPADEADEDDEPPTVGWRSPPELDIRPVSLAPGRAEFKLAANNKRDAEPAVRIELLPSKSLVQPNDEFDVTVHVNAANRVSHLPITLNYRPEMLEVLAVSAGDFLGSQSETQFMADYARPGRIVMGASRLGEGPGVTGRGSVATIRFRALEEGRAVVSFEKGKALNRDLEKIGPVSKKRAVIRVGTEADQPEDPGRTEQPGQASRVSSVLRG